MTGSDGPRLDKLREDVDLLLDIVEGNKRSGHPGLLDEIRSMKRREVERDGKIDQILEKDNKRESAEQARHDQRIREQDRNRRILVAFASVASTVIAGLLLAVLTQVSGLS